MNPLRYLFRHSVNSAFRLLATLCGKPLPEIDRVVVVSPHPDDEILGCGGLVTRLNQQKKEVNILLLTKGENCTTQIAPETLIVERRKLTEQVLEAVGQPKERVYYLDFTDGNIHPDDPESKKLKHLLEQINPQAVFVPSRFEGWNDHLQSNLIVQRFLENNTTVNLFEYCVWLWFTTPFQKAFNISWKNARLLKIDKKEQQLKKEAIAIYMDAKNPQGIPYSGDLPPIMIRSCSLRMEYFFEIKRLGS